MGICERRHILVQGTVQGVGFRPFVYREAAYAGLSGWVRNTPEGVAIEAQGERKDLDAFISNITRRSPPLAEIRSLDQTVISLKDERGFAIVTSAAQGHITPAISPDIATCDDCLREMSCVSDRRHRYPFTNCTNCGPRYTIIEGFPYDRELTSMKNFAMCPMCRSEYDDPLDRRFHAQPNACPECGPQVTIVEMQGLNHGCHSERSPEGAKSKNPLPLKTNCKGSFTTFRMTNKTQNTDPLARTRELLNDGRIVAIKGLGGFHLACDATNVGAVSELRARKCRDMKPFAIMVQDLDAARSICHVSDDEAKLLTSPRRPIALLAKRENIPVADMVAPGNRLLGVMLPYTPLHHLLFENQRTNEPTNQRIVLVMTSANMSDEPIISDNEEAIARLKGITDAFLMHDRPIHMRTDDSVVRPAGKHTIMMRRARGFVPQAIELPFAVPRILAVGGDIKNAICITDGQRVYLSQHIGDLANPEAHAHFERTIEHVCSLFDIEPEIIACDMHPDYFSSMYMSRATRHVSRVSVQHHHAHIASCMAEHGLPNAPVLGIALDGAGYGPDGTIWGGEILRADYAGYTRLARIRPVPQPGGDVAAREPWRMAMAYLGNDAEQLPALALIDMSERSLVRQSIVKEINAPLTSSCGRLFDAAAAVCGLATHNAFEGHAAMLLEQAAVTGIDEAYEVDFVVSASETLDMDFRPALLELTNDLRRGLDTGIVSARFHNTVAAAFANAIKHIGGSEPIVLSGGCMQNAYLLTGLIKALEDQGRTVYTHRSVPPNDGGLALGQAAVAAFKAISKSFNVGF